MPEIAIMKETIESPSAMVGKGKKGRGPREILADLRAKRESFLSHPSLQKTKGYAKPPRSPRLSDGRKTPPNDGATEVVNAAIIVAHATAAKPPRSPTLLEQSRAQEILATMKERKSNLSTILETIGPPKKKSKRKGKGESSTAKTASSTTSWVSSTGDNDSFCYSETSSDSVGKSSLEFYFETDENSSSTTTPTHIQVGKAVAEAFSKVPPETLKSSSEEEHVAEPKTPKKAKKTSRKDRESGETLPRNEKKKKAKTKKKAAVKEAAKEPSKETTTKEPSNEAATVNETTKEAAVTTPLEAVSETTEEAAVTTAKEAAKETTNKPAANESTTEAAKESTKDDANEPTKEAAKKEPTKAPTKQKKRKKKKSKNRKARSAPPTPTGSHGIEGHRSTLSVLLESVSEMRELSVCPTPSPASTNRHGILLSSQGSLSGLKDLPSLSPLDSSWGRSHHSRSVSTQSRRSFSQRSVDSYGSAYSSACSSPYVVKKKYRGGKKTKLVAKPSELYTGIAGDDMTPSDRGNPLDVAFSMPSPRLSQLSTLRLIEETKNKLLMGLDREAEYIELSPDPNDRQDSMDKWTGFVGEDEPDRLTPDLISEGSPFHTSPEELSPFKRSESVEKVSNESRGSKDKTSSQGSRDALDESRSPWMQPLGLKESCSTVSSPRRLRRHRSSLTYSTTEPTVTSPPLVVPQKTLSADELVMGRSSPTLFLDHSSSSPSNIGGNSFDVPSFMKANRKPSPPSIPNALSLEDHHPLGKETTHIITKPAITKQQADLLDEFLSPKSSKNRLGEVAESADAVRSKRKKRKGKKNPLRIAGEEEDEMEMTPLEPNAPEDAPSTPLVKGKSNRHTRKRKKERISPPKVIDADKAHTVVSDLTNATGLEELVQSATIRPGRSTDEASVEAPVRRASERNLDEDIGSRFCGGLYHIATQSGMPICQDEV